MLERMIQTLTLTRLDAAALAVFAALGVGYQWYADYSATARAHPGKEIDRIALIVAFANRNFNHGLRACYFGVAALSWFLHPALMIAVTLAVI